MYVVKSPQFMGVLPLRRSCCVASIQYLVAR